MPQLPLGCLTAFVTLVCLFPCHGTVKIYYSGDVTKKEEAKSLLLLGFLLPLF